MSLTLLARKWVHKRFDDNVFIGEPAAVADGNFSVVSAFPVHHELYNDSLSGLSASGYLIEVARQANLAVCHRFYDVPLESTFLVTSIDWQFERAEPFVVAELEPYSVVTNVSDVLRRKGAVCKVATRSEFLAGNERFLSGGATFLISSRPAVVPAEPEDGPSSARPVVSPSEAQVRHASNVLIGRAHGERIPLFINPKHSYFFEHPNVHVPGMMLLEGGKQAAVYAALRAFSVLQGMYGDLQAGQIRFGRFADLKETVWMTARFVAIEETARGFRLPVEIRFEQAGREIGRITGTLAFLDADEVVRTSALVRQRIHESGSRALKAQPASGEGR
jgi:hypothetical protein